MITKVSSSCLDLIKEFEGFSSKPYLCTSKVPTIGFGTTRYPNGKKVTLQDKPISVSQAEKYLISDVKSFEIWVDNYTTDNINQNQFDALVSLMYNIGPNQYKDSTLLKLVNKNPNDERIRKQFSRWNKSDGKISKGLINRRNKELELYFRPWQK